MSTYRQHANEEFRPPKWPIAGGLPEPSSERRRKVCVETISDCVPAVFPDVVPTRSHRDEGLAYPSGGRCSAFRTLELEEVAPIGDDERASTHRDRSVEIMRHWRPWRVKLIDLDPKGWALLFVNEVMLSTGGQD
jgi:hypothetical protein